MSLGVVPFSPDDDDDDDWLSSTSSSAHKGANAAGQVSSVGDSDHVNAAALPAGHPGASKSEVEDVNGDRGGGDATRELREEGEDDEQQLPMQLPLLFPDLDDINWVDLEFLDLASGPPANMQLHQQEKNRNRNPTLGDNFPDIFFDMTTSGLFNADDHAKLLSEPFKDSSVPLDLDTVEKNLLADLFPPTARIDDVEEDDERPSSSKSGKVAEKEETSGFVPPLSGGKSGGKTCSSTANSDSVGASSSSELSDGVYAVPMDVLQIISKNFTELQDDFDRRVRAEEEDEGKGGEEDREQSTKEEVKDKAPFKPRTRVLRVHSRCGTVLSTSPDSVPKNAVAQISLVANKKEDTTQVTLLPAPGKEGQKHSFQVGTANLRKALKLLGPLRLERLSLFKSILLNRPEERSKDGDGGAKAEGKGRHVCSEPGCNRRFNRPAKLKQHLLSHKNIKPYKCTEKDCTWTFSDDYKLKRHLATHAASNSDSKPGFKCTLEGCGSSFTTASNLRKHLALHERPRSHACGVCTEAFATKRALTEHVRVHADFYPTFSCLHKVEEGKEKGQAECGEKFYSKKDLKAHTLQVHSQQKVPIKVACGFEGCGKEFSGQELLKTHSKIHTGSRPYPCSFAGCSWAFPTSSKLRRHERGHTNVRNHVCDTCGKSYLRPEHLREHALSHQEQGERKRFICAFPGCGSKYAARSSLYAHMKDGRDHHHILQQQQQEEGEDEPEEHVIMFRCLLEDCPLLFERSSDLGQHVKEAHMGDVITQSSPASASSSGLELDFVALLSSVETADQVVVATTTKAEQQASNELEGMPLQEQLLILAGGMKRTSTEAMLDSSSALVTVDATAITPVKARKRKESSEGNTKSEMLSEERKVEINEAANKALDL